MMNFRNSREAVVFGQSATDEERDQLQIQRSKFLEETYILKESGDFDAAMVAAVNAQFCKEALCANIVDEDGHDIKKFLYLDEKIFKLYWLDGITEIVKGCTIAKAMTHAGYSQGAVRALDYYEEIFEKEKLKKC